MELTKNSLSARLYRWFYATKTMPTNLCPYFWKLIIMYISIIPAGIISLPVIIHRKDEDDWNIRLIGGLLIYAIIYFGFLALFAPITYLIWGYFTNNDLLRSWQIGGFVVLCVSIVVAITFGIVYFLNKRKQRKNLAQHKYIWDENGDYIPNPNYKPYEPKPNLIVEFVKAKYQKYCPKIDWK